MHFTKKPPRIVRFLLGGGAGVALYYAAFLPLSIIYDAYVLPAIIGFFLSTAANFLIQKHWTFENKDKRTVKKQRGYYFIMSGILFGLNLLFLHIGVDLLGHSKIVSQLISSSILTSISYFVTSLIFKNPEP